MEPGRTDTKGRSHGRSHALLEPAPGLGVHGAAHNGRAAGLQGFDAALDVVGGDHAMAVDPHDHVALSFAEGDVERRRLDAPGVGDDPHVPAPTGDEIPGRVCGPTVDDEHLDDLPVGLGRNRVEAGVDVRLLVEDRDGHGHGRPGVGHGGHQVDGSSSVNVKRRYTDGNRRTASARAGIGLRSTGRV